MRLLPRVLKPDVVSMVDIELLLGLGTGLTAWLPEASAMRQALYDALLAYETVGWTSGAWVDAVRQFSSSTTESTGAGTIANARPWPPAAAQRIALFPERQLSSPARRRRSPWVLTTPCCHRSPYRTLPRPG